MGVSKKEISLKFKLMMIVNIILILELNLNRSKSHERGYKQIQLHYLIENIYMEKCFATTVTNTSSEILNKI